MIATKMIKKLNEKNLKSNSSRILIMGLTFKENCPDLRNSGVTSVINELKKYECDLDLYDPWASSIEIQSRYGVKPTTNLLPNSYDGIVVAVAHNEFKEMGSQEISKLGKKPHVLYDLKYLFSKEESDLRL